MGMAALNTDEEKVAAKVMRPRMVTQDHLWSGDMDLGFRGLVGELRSRMSELGSSLLWLAFPFRSG